MRTRLFHIFLAVTLTFAVTDYLWVNLLHDDPVAAEMEKAEEKEEVRELEIAEEKDEFLPSNLHLDGSSFSFKKALTGFVKCGNSFASTGSYEDAKLYLLHQQLILHG